MQARKVFFTVKLRPRREEKGAFIVSVGKNVARKAVDRNRLKRRMRAILGRMIDKQSRMQCIVIAKPGLQDLSFRELEGEITEAVKRFHKPG